MPAAARLQPEPFIRAANLAGEVKRKMRVVNHANLPPEEIARLESELSGQQNLNEVMQWALSQPPGVFIPAVVADVIMQDEFTHDVIVPYRDNLTLVYDTT